MDYSNVEATIEIECSKCHKHFNPNISNDDLDEDIIEVQCNYCGHIMEVKSQDIMKEIEQSVVDEIQKYFK